MKNKVQLGIVQIDNGWLVQYTEHVQVPTRQNGVNEAAQVSHVIHCSNAFELSQTVEDLAKKAEAKLEVVSE